MNPPPATDASQNAEIRAVYACYRALRPGSGLGGLLLFAGELGDLSGHPPRACHLLRAASIAGAASLAASSSPETCKKALHSGAAAFLVTSLDEALRILKNEIRKKLPVAVVIGQPAEAIAAAMLARGVQPDLLGPAPEAQTAPWKEFQQLGARVLQPATLPADEAFHLWPLNPAWMRHAAELEARIAALQPPLDEEARRWLRLSPRYLGAKARRLRSLGCNEATATQLGALLAELL